MHGNVIECKMDADVVFVAVIIVTGEKGKEDVLSVNVAAT